VPTEQRSPEGALYEICVSRFHEGNKRTNVPQSHMRKSGEIITKILINEDLQTTDTETSIESNFAVLKFRHMIGKKNKSD
jgi:hypothetical protein